MLKLIKSPQEMFDFIKSVQNDFDSIEEYEEWFDFSLNWDETTGEILETIDDYTDRGGWFGDVPRKNEYPVVICYINEKSRDRYGNIGCAMWDWISVKGDNVECRM